MTRPAVLYFVATLVSSSAIAQQAVYVEKLSVAAPSRLDWMYPLVGRSPADQPDGLLEDYSSRAQKYEFYGPAQEEPGRSYPLILFVSPSDGPVGWRHFGPACQRYGVLFAGPHDAGNGRPLAERVRITLDVLDDVRRRYDVDPERTYIGGFSGGAFVAAQIAWHLPEHFGGLIAIGHVVHPPAKNWHLHRVRERLSVAMICGGREPICDMVEKLNGPLHEALRIRTSYYAVPGLRHVMPSAAVCERAFEWLEQDVAARDRFAAQYPAGSMGSPRPREEWATLLLAEAKVRLAAPDIAYTGIVQLEWIKKRWPDLPEADEAGKLLEGLASQDEHAWRKGRDTELRDWLRVHAEVHDAYAHAKLDGRSGHTRFEAARVAIEHWQRLLELPEDADAKTEIQERIASLEEVIASAPPPAKARPRPGGRVTFQGITTVRQLVDFLTGAFGEHGFEFTLDEEAIAEAGVSLDVPLEIQVDNASLEGLLEAALEPAGLDFRRRGNSFQIGPKAAAQPR
jgi:pimeloyl-ACP methyl ester carboxylesterase